MHNEPIYSKKYGTGFIVLASIDTLWLLYALFTAFMFTQQTGSEADIAIGLIFFVLLALTVPLALINMFYVLRAVKQRGKRLILTFIFGCVAIAPVAYVALS